MSIEKSLISRAGPQMLAAKARTIILNEGCKGCLPDISPEPVALEPFYEPMRDVKDLLVGRQQVLWIHEPPPQEKDLVRLQIFISQEQNFDWLRSELFLKQLQSIEHRAGLEVVGNKREISISILCHRDDEPVISAAFRGQFDQCEIAFQEKSPLSELSGGDWDDAIFYDFFTPPPYSHLLTRPDELHVSPFEPLVSAMADISAPAIGIYQAIFQPVDPDHNWSRNIRILRDLEYKGKQHENPQHPQRYPQQPPSGSLQQMSLGLETKAHKDKPFYAIALRFGIIGAGENAQEHLRCMGTVSNFFLHESRLLDYITEVDYRHLLTREQIGNMFRQGLTYHPGFLVKSWELTGPVHVPPASIIENRKIKLKMLEPLSIQNEELLEGTPIGIGSYKGELMDVCIREKQKLCHIHVLGKTGTGKTNCIEQMICSDAIKGNGVAVFDPHGDMAKRLLRILSEECKDRIIYFYPGDKDWVPIWNPLKIIPGQDIGRITDNIVGAFKSVVTGWGDRLEHLLRHAIFALLQIPNTSLLDVSNLLSTNREKYRYILKEIYKVVDSEVARQFWKYDFFDYKKDDFRPAQHKLSKLIMTGRASRMLTQPESLFDFRHIMDDGMIFLANLSDIGSETGKILGCFMLSLFHLNALSRSDIPPEQRKPFHIYCDEAHWFVTEALEDLISETRKYNVSLTLAHQNMGQFGHKKVDALSNVGSTILFNVDAPDASFFVKGLSDMVKVKDIVSLDSYEAIARIKTDIVRIKTKAPLKEPDENYEEQIIENSRRRYYRPAHEVREEIRRRYSGESMSTWESAPEPNAQESGDPSEELNFDTF